MPDYVTAKGMRVLGNLFFRNGDAEHIHTCRGMLDADIEALENGKDFSVEADLA